MLYGSADQAFYIRRHCPADMSRHGALQRELEAPSQAGVIERTVRGRHIIFKANAGCPIFQELKGIVAKAIRYRRDPQEGDGAFDGTHTLGLLRGIADRDLKDGRTEGLSAEV